MKRSPWRVFSPHVLRVVVRSVAAVVVLWIAVTIPLPRTLPEFFVKVQVPSAVLLFILYIGKLLYDSFFYDHYQR